ncbi:MAG: hypothetical protein KKC75_05700 [Nanoarchaeota archaeon]|nr:hypothetical protein [Nanoarchaeota archaeon]MBU1004930.1 hypothetical protein [Nanoarchaeota archaeon]MBU1945624.1 hypothetical protein [Nanoarchaeota archaeon]
MKNGKAYICNVCNKRFPFENIRYSIDGKRILCIVCHNKVMEKQEKKKQAYSAAKEPLDSIKLVCLDCKYHFSIRKGSKVKLRCPYCSNSNLSKDDLTAEKLIEEVSKI